MVTAQLSAPALLSDHHDLAEVSSGEPELKGLGKALLRDAILRTLQAAEIAGIRAVLVHALHEKAAAFYRHAGFAPSPISDTNLMLTLKDARAVLTDS